MKNPPDQFSDGIKITVDDKGATTLHLEGRMDAGTASPLIKRVKSLFRKNLSV